MTTKRIKRRLEYLRGELRAERISQGELCELQSLASHIEPGDVELLEPAGVPEYYLEKCGTREAAERSKDAHELEHAHACQIVECGDDFYVVWAD